VTLRTSGIAHSNVNCSDLVRSKRFYTELLGLHAAAHTAPERPQDCRAFGFPGDGRWDAWMLTASDDPGGTAIDLLEWKQPRPVGQPPAQPNQLGFARLGFLVPDAAALRARLGRAGVECLGRGAAAFLARDPDGTLLEFAQQPVGSTRPAHVVVNCSSLSRSLEWYQAVLELEIEKVSNPALELAGWPGLPGPIEAQAASLVPRARPAGFGLQLLEWRQPRPVGRPAAQPNQLGIFRMAFLVDDARAAWEELHARGIECAQPVWLEMGPEIPIEGLWAVFFPDPDGACLELIQTPRVLSR
jgi:catechol 2,3-dioxygenase-like lactoylglutathione lyase family enzyme